MSDDDEVYDDEEYFGDDAQGVWGQSPITDALFEIRSEDEGRFDPWGTDDVLRYGDLDADACDDFIDEVTVRAEEDAADGLLLDDNNRSDSLEEMLREVAQRMDKVALERGVIRQDIMADVAELEGLAQQSTRLTDGSASKEAKEYEAELDRAKLDADLAENRSRNLHDVHAPAPWITALLVIGAAAGLVLDVVFVQSSFAAQQSQGIGDTLSLVVAIALALILAVVATAAGYQLARGVRDYSMAEGSVPDDVQNHYNSVMAKKHQESQRSFRMGLILGAIALVIFGFIAYVRLTSLEEEGATLGMTLVLIGIALVGLGLLAFESFSRTRLQMKEIAEYDHDDAERVLETVRLRSQAESTLRGRADEFRTFTGQGPDHHSSGQVPDPQVALDVLIADALSSIDTHFTVRVEQSYKSAAVKWLQSTDDTRLTPQIPRFQNLEPEDVPRTALVERYLNLAASQTSGAAGGKGMSK